MKLNKGSKKKIKALITATSITIREMKKINERIQRLEQVTLFQKKRMLVLPLSPIKWFKNIFIPSSKIICPDCTLTKIEAKKHLRQGGFNKKEVEEMFKK